VLTKPGGLDPRHVWELVAAQRVRTLVVAGNAVCQPLVDELLAAEAAGRPHDLSSLDSVTSSGTVLSDRIKRALHERANGHDHRRDRLERGRPVRLRGHLVGRRPAVAVPPGGGDAGAYRVRPASRSR